MARRKKLPNAKGGKKPAPKAREWGDPTKNEKEFFGFASPRA